MNGQGRDIPPVAANEVDATGAGDVWAAAFAINLAETRDIAFAANFASAAAAMSIEHHGMQGIPTRNAITARMGKLTQRVGRGKVRIGVIAEADCYDALLASRTNESNRSILVTSKIPETLSPLWPSSRRGRAFVTIKNVPAGFEVMKFRALSNPFFSVSLRIMPGLEILWEVPSGKEILLAEPFTSTATLGVTSRSCVLVFPGVGINSSP